MTGQPQRVDPTALDLFRHLKEDVEDSHWTWPACDVVAVLTEWFERHGIDPQASPDDYQPRPGAGGDVLLPTPEGSHAVIEADAVRALVGYVEQRDGDKPPRCPHGCGKLRWADDQWRCPKCGDEWPDTPELHAAEVK